MTLEEVNSFGKNIFSFSHNVFISINPFHNKPWILAPLAIVVVSWRCVRRASVCQSVRSCMPVSVNSSFKKLLFRNYRLDFYEILQKCSLGVLFPRSMKNSGCHGNQSKKPLKIFSSQTTNWIALLFCRNVP